MNKVYTSLPSKLKRKVGAGNFHYSLFIIYYLLLTPKNSIFVLPNIKSDSHHKTNCFLLCYCTRFKITFLNRLCKAVFPPYIFLCLFRPSFFCTFSALHFLRSTKNGVWEFLTSLILTDLKTKQRNNKKMKYNEKFWAAVRSGAGGWRTRLIWIRLS